MLNTQEKSKCCQLGGFDHPYGKNGKEYTGDLCNCFCHKNADSTESWEERLIQKVREIRALVEIEDAQELFFKILKSEREKVRQEVIEKIKLWKKNNYFTDPTTNEEVADEILKNLSNK